jgi:hypothetical protein
MEHPDLAGIVGVAVLRLGAADQEQVAVEGEEASVGWKRNDVAYLKWT